MLTCALSTVYAQEKPFKFGIKGGISFIHLENYGNGYYSDFEPRQGWNMGVLLQYKKGGFFNYSIVPEIMITESRTSIDLLYITDCMTTIQTVDIPVNIKLGLRLSRIFRPYILGNVYASYMIRHFGEFFDMLDVDNTQSGKPINKLFFGVSAGLGFELWKFQMEGRYRWNLNRIQTDDYSALKQMGLEISCAFLF